MKISEADSDEYEKEQIFFFFFAAPNCNNFAHVSFGPAPFFLICNTSPDRIIRPIPCEILMQFTFRPAKYYNDSEEG